MCLYSFVNNNPICYRDPSGEIFLIDNLIGAAVGFVVDVVVQYVTTGEVNWTEATIAAGAGFVTSGVSSIGSAILKTGGKMAVKELAKAGIKTLAKEAGKRAAVYLTATVAGAVTQEYLESEFIEGEEFTLGGVVGNLGERIISEGITRGISKLGGRVFNKVFRRGVQAAVEEADDAVIVSCKPWRLIGGLSAFDPRTK